MYYIFENQDATKTVVLLFYRSELLNDLDGYGFVEGDVMNVGDPNSEAHEHLKHGKHQTQDITQDTNIDLVTRHLDLALSWCRVKLHPYTKTPVADGTALDDTLAATTTYVITLYVPEDFPEGDALFLEQLIHNLLVYYALWSWLSITKPEGADKWLAKANSLVDEIKGSLARRCGRVKRPLQPF